MLLCCIRTCDSSEWWFGVWRHGCIKLCMLSGQHFHFTASSESYSIFISWEWLYRVTSYCFMLLVTLLLKISFFAVFGFGEFPFLFAHGSRAGRQSFLSSSYHFVQCSGLVTNISDINLIFSISVFNLVSYTDVDLSLFFLAHSVLPLEITCPLFFRTVAIQDSGVCPYSSFFFFILYEIFGTGSYCFPGYIITQRVA